MKIRNVGRGKFQPVRSTGLVAGQRVQGRVISRLGEGLFRIGAAGQLFNAESDLPLEPGQRLTARVEVGESRVFLRVQEEPDREANAPGEDRSPAEIRRVLVGLGYRSDPLEIVEFQERLDRYQRYGKMAGVEPSDIWVLALLWSRGMKGGADAFSLLSYYLRRAAFNRVSQYSLLQPGILLNLLDPNEDKDGIYVKDGQVSGSNGISDYPAERKREAGMLLNRSGAEHGCLLQARTFYDTSCVLSLKEDERILMRWTDNPTLPVSLIEAARSQGRLRLRVHGPAAVAPEEITGLDEWEASLAEASQDLNLEIESIEYYKALDPEVLRFLFWRRWEEEFVRNVRA